MSNESARGIISWASLDTKRQDEHMGIGCDCTTTPCQAVDDGSGPVNRPPYFLGTREYILIYLPIRDIPSRITARKDTQQCESVDATRCYAVDNNCINRSVLFSLAELVQSAISLSLNFKYILNCFILSMSVYLFSYNEQTYE